MNNASHVIVASPYPILSCGIKSCLANIRGIASLHELLPTRLDDFRSLRGGQWELLILDGTAAEFDVLECVRWLGIEFSSKPFLFLFNPRAVSDALWALQSGASGAFPVTGEPEQLRVAVRRILAGGKYVHESVGETLAHKTERNLPPVSEVLSQREYQVLKKLAQGKRLTVIAADLCLSIATVSTYRRRVLEKLNVESNVDLARLAFQSGVLYEERA